MLDARGIRQPQALMRAATHVKGSAVPSARAATDRQKAARAYGVLSGVRAGSRSRPQKSMRRSSTELALTRA